jgi:hypothetical protein
MWNRAPALILAALCLAALLPAPARKVTAVPAPEWVRPLPVELRKVESIDGIEELIRDTQTWVSDDRVVSYYHTARRPVSSSALASASRISLAFDRRYQTYAWHMIRIRRGSAVIDALPSAEILQPIGAEDEDASDPDEATVTAFLRDVRVGDIVEYAASTEGEPPELRRRFTRRLNLDARTPVGLIQHRLLWPADRPLHIQALGTTLEPERTREGDRDVYVWRVLDSARRVSEPHAPS